MTIDHLMGLRFKEMHPRISEVIERHLPGTFENWAKENSTWDGDIKTVHNRDKDPRTKSCAWIIFIASEMPDDFLDFIDRKADEAALEELENNLHVAVNALRKLSVRTRTRLSEGSSEAYHQSTGGRSEKFMPPDFNLELVGQALLSGIPAARDFLMEKGGDSRADRRAAAVAGACQTVYENRTGKKAPRTALDTPEKKEGKASKPAPFTAFTQEVFVALGIHSRVSSALSRLERFRS